MVDGESGDSLVDDDEPIRPLQSAQVDDYTDPNWEPEPIDAGPGKVFASYRPWFGHQLRDRLPHEQTKRCRQYPRQHLRFEGSLRQGAPSSSCAASPGCHQWKLRKGGTFASRVIFGDVRSLYKREQRRNLEILKIRFGEAPLQVCEVMLKDMTDSKRIDQHVQSQSSVSDQLKEPDCCARC